MPPRATIVIPTRHRALTLRATLAVVAPQAHAHNTTVVVVDDGPSEPTRAAAMDCSATYIALEDRHGLNVGRNTGIAATDAPLVIFLDDDAVPRGGWLEALIAADDTLGPDVGALAGRIVGHIDGAPWATARGLTAPITTLDLGSTDCEVRYGWGANLALRRAALDAVGPFDEALTMGAGDEQEWQDRLHAAGLRVHYVAAATVDHRRTGADARWRALASAEYRRGHAARRWDAWQGQAPTTAAELATLARSLGHTIGKVSLRRGSVLVAHSAGRAAQAAVPTPPPVRPGVDDFLSGRSGHVAGRDAAVRTIADRLLDGAGAVTLRRIDAIAARAPARNVHVVGVDRPGSVMPAALVELQRSRHTVSVHTGLLKPGVGKFARINELLAEHPPGDADWLVIIDDDVALPAAFLDRFLAVADAAGLQMAQPAHRRRSHAAWPVTQRTLNPRVAARQTRFVEIGPVTALRADTLTALVPFPSLQMGWGLDLAWGATARAHGWLVGVIDATPIMHRSPVAEHYDHGAAVAEAQAFLADRSYVTRDEAAWYQPLPLEGTSP